MATDWKTDLIFEGHQNARVGAGRSFGWAESYYQNTENADTALRSANADVTGPGTNLCLLRRGFLSAMWRIAFIRVTDLRNPSVVKIASPTGLDGLIPVPTSGLVPQVQCAIAVDITRLPHDPDTFAHHRRMAFRGLSVGIINGNVIEIESGTYPFVLTFLNLIGYKQSGLDQPPGGNKPKYWKIAFQDTSLTHAYTPINNLTLNSGDARFCTLVAPGLAAVKKGDRIIIKGVTGPRGINRTWTVLADAGAGLAISLGKSRRFLDLVPIVTVGGRCRIKRISLGDPDQYLITGLTSRKTGRPLRQLRGRRGPA